MTSGRDETRREENQTKTMAQQKIPGRHGEWTTNLGNNNENTITRHAPARSIAARRQWSERSI